MFTGDVQRGIRTWQIGHRCWKELKIPKLSAKKREEWFKILQESPEFECHHVFVSHEVIDKFWHTEGGYIRRGESFGKIFPETGYGVDGRFA